MSGENNISYGHDEESEDDYAIPVIPDVVTLDD